MISGFVNAQNVSLTALIPYKVSMYSLGKQSPRYIEMYCAFQRCLSLAAHKLVILCSSCVRVGQVSSAFSTPQKFIFLSKAPIFYTDIYHVAQRVHISKRACFLHTDLFLVKLSFLKFSTRICEVPRKIVMLISKTVPVVFVKLKISFRILTKGLLTSTCLI